MKTYRVRMLAFGDPGEVREVDVPDQEAFGGVTEDLLHSIFYWGQNEFQEKPHPSLSMGDVVEMDGEFYVYMAIGAKRITPEALELYEAMPRRDRCMASILMD